LGNIDITAGAAGARPLNVSAYQGALYTKSGRNASMSIDGSREAKEEGVSNEGLGDHRKYEGG